MTRLQDALFACRVACFAALVVPILLYMPLPRLSGWLDRPQPSARRDFAAAQRLVHRVDAILAHAGPIVRSGCLTRGWTRYMFLRRAGLRADLVFGIGQVDGTFSGHCWIECDGQPLAEPRDPRATFAESYRIGAARHGKSHPAREARRSSC